MPCSVSWVIFDRSRLVGGKRSKFPNFVKALRRAINAHNFNPVSACGEVFQVFGLSVTIDGLSV